MGNAGFGGSFDPIVQYKKWEIHKVSYEPGCAEIVSLLILETFFEKENGGPGTAETVGPGGLLVQVCG